MKLQLNTDKGASWRIKSSKTVKFDYEQLQ